MCITGIILKYVAQTYESRASTLREARMSSEDRFSHPGIVQAGDIYEVFSSRGETVLTTTEIDEQIDWASRPTVLRKLNAMAESEELGSKKAGENENAGIVWYLPDDLEDIPQPTPDPIKLIYRHPWFSLIAGGFVFIGSGFILFLPGFFGEGLFLGVVDRELLVLVSLILYAIGVLMVSLGSGGVIGNVVMPMIRGDQSDTQSK